MGAEAEVVIGAARFYAGDHREAARPISVGAGVPLCRCRLRVEVRGWRALIGSGGSGDQDQ